MKVTEIAKEISDLVPKLIKGLKSKYLVSKEVTSSQLIILTNLEDAQFLTLKELAKKIGISTATASLLVDKLVNTGYIVRRQDIDDRRKINLSLTARGKKTLHRFRKEIEYFWIKILTRALNPKEQTTYLKILRKIVKELGSE